jgi:selenocysteine lyase/cysteine desulfurase
MGILAIAHALPWRRGDRILVLEGEFPTNVTPWQQTARRHDLELVWMKAEDFRTDRDRALEEFERHLAAGIRLVAISAVQFTTGQRMPLETMGGLCRRHGSELFVDAIQAAGIVPLDMERMQIDYLACGSHKWLMAPEGVGFVYVSPEKADSLLPDMSAWISHEDAFAFLGGGPETLRYDRPFQKGARMLEAGTFNSIGCAGLKASVELIQSIGVAKIHSHVQQWLNALEPKLQERGFESARMTDSADRSGILSVWPPDDRPAADWARTLGEHGISCASPAGWLRFAPHWPNGLEEVERVVAAIDTIRR